VTVTASGSSAALGKPGFAGDFTGPLRASGLLTASGGATVTGLLTANSGATVTGALNANNALNVTGLLSANGGLTTSGITAGTLTVVGTFAANSGATVTGGLLTASSGLTVTGTLTANNALNVTGFFTAGSDLHVNGTLFANSTVNVTGGLNANGGVVTSNIVASGFVRLNKPNTGDFVKAAYESFQTSGSDAFVVFFDDNGAQGARLLRNTGLWQSISDGSLKQDVVAVQPVLDRVMQLRPVRFRWKPSDAAGIGVVAQEAEQVFPELVSEGGPPDRRLKSVSYTELGVLAVAALQEMKQRYDARLAELEDRLARMTPAPAPTTREKS
jgi:hypothetical protein